MKKLLSLFLALCILLSVVGCTASQDSLQNRPQDLLSGETTEPLYWPPLPVETEETTGSAEQTLPQTQEGQSATSGSATKPTTKPTQNTTDATYYPRDDQDQDEPSRPSDTQPESNQPSQNTPTQPPQDTPTQPPQDTPTQPPQDRPSQTTPTQPPETTPTEQETVPPTTQAPKPGLDPNGSYDSKWDVALFIVTYGRLPNNYITKRQAKSLGWSGDGGDPIRLYAPGKCIGGDRFYNNEGLLPDEYTYFECDIGVLGANSRGAQRLVYTKTGLVYYTYNHYKSFTLLYGTP